jgi:hypothetical protein
MRRAVLHLLVSFRKGSDLLNLALQKLVPHLGCSRHLYLQHQCLKHQPRSPQGLASYNVSTFLCCLDVMASP